MHVQTTSNSSARSAASISSGSRPRRRRPRGSCRPPGSKSSKNTCAHDVGARRVVGAVDDHQRLVAEHLEPAGHRARRRSPRARCRRRAARRRTPRPRSARQPRCRPGGAVQRHEHLGVDRRRRAQVERRGRRARACSRARRSRSPRTSTLAPPAARKMSTSSGSVSPTTTALPGLMMPAFSRAMSAVRRPGELGVVEADVGDHGDLGVARRWSRPSGRAGRPRPPPRRRRRRRTSGTPPRSTISK